MGYSLLPLDMPTIILLVWIPGKPEARAIARGFRADSNVMLRQSKSQRGLPKRNPVQTSNIHHLDTGQPVGFIFGPLHLSRCSCSWQSMSWVEQNSPTLVFFNIFCAFATSYSFIHNLEPTYEILQNSSIFAGSSIERLGKIDIFPNSWGCIHKLAYFTLTEI